MHLLSGIIDELHDENEDKTDYRHAMVTYNVMLIMLNSRSGRDVTDALPQKNLQYLVPTKIRLSAIDQNVIKCII